MSGKRTNPKVMELVKRIRELSEEEIRALPPLYRELYIFVIRHLKPQDISNTTDYKGDKNAKKK